MDLLWNEQGSKVFTNNSLHAFMDLLSKEQGSKVSVDSLLLLTIRIIQLRLNTINMTRVLDTWIFSGMNKEAKFLPIILFMLLYSRVG